MKSFRTLDLNLLRVFDSVMNEGSLTRAADVLAITQPAASQALRRLHDWAGEPLFERSASGMRPTPRAQALWPEVRTALQRLQQALAPEAFDARSDPVAFRLTMADATAVLLAPRLIGELQRLGAVVDLRIVPLTTRDPQALLTAEEADLAIGHFPALIGRMMGEGERTPLRQHQLHTSPYVCVMRRDHPLGRAELTLDAYCAAPHLIVSVSGRAHGAVDEVLAPLGRSRRVMLTVNQYHTAGRVVAESDLVTALPASLVAATGVADRLLTRPLPLEIPPLVVSMVWLARRDAEPAHRWLRALVERNSAFS